MKVCSEILRVFDGECEEVRHELGIDSTVSGYSDKGPAAMSRMD